MPASPDFRRRDLACDEALRVLDLARPGETDAAALARAEGHLVTCASCREVVAAREKFDRQVSRLVHETEVPPAGMALLRLRLAAARVAHEPESVSAANSWPLTIPERPQPVSTPPDSPQTLPAPTTRTQPMAPVAVAAALMSSGMPTVAADAAARGAKSPVSRRTWLRRGAATALLALLALLSVWTQSLPRTSFSRLVGALAQLDWSHLDRQIARLSPISRLQDGSEPRLPDEIETRQIAMAPGTLEVDQVQAAVFVFQFTRRGANQVQAALAVIPVGQVQDANARQRFLGVPPLVDGDLCAATWVEGDLAYVCCVKGNRSDLQELARPRPSA